MTQFKEKGEGKEFVSAGLFTYPILMAGDILLYQTDLVPVGDDQRQHVELARDIAQRFNSRYGETFKIPAGVYPRSGRASWTSRSRRRRCRRPARTAQGTVLVLDAPDTIRKKFKTAVTDSEREMRYEPGRKPGVSNLIEILSVATGAQIPDVERHFDGRGYGDLKGDVGEAVVELFAPIRERYAELRADERRAAAAARDRRREGP